jgi:hypothetical protein
MEVVIDSIGPSTLVVYIGAREEVDSETGATMGYKTGRSRFPSPVTFDVSDGIGQKFFIDLVQLDTSLFTENRLLFRRTDVIPLVFVIRPICAEEWAAKR